MRRFRGQTRPDGTSILVRDELLPGGALACDECGEPATDFRAPVPEMAVVYRDLRFKFCPSHGSLTRHMRSFRDITEREFRELEGWPLPD